MGNKLVAMVRIFLILFSFGLLEANDDSVTIINQDKALYKLHVDPLINEARIYKIVGDGKSFQLQQSYVGKPHKKDLKKTNELNHGNKLVGNVKQELLLEVEFMKKINWADFLAKACEIWIAKELGKKLKQFMCTQI